MNEAANDIDASHGTLLRAKGMVPLPFTGFRRSSSVEESIALLKLICGRLAIGVETVEQKPDGFVFEVPACPYGYNRPDQQGVLAQKPSKSALQTLSSPLEN